MRNWRECFMPRAERARGKVRGALPRSPARGTPPETPAPFPFRPMFQNGPRRQGCAPENLFKTGKDFPPPRPNRAPLTAAGRSEDLPMRRERGQMQRPNHSDVVGAYRLPMVGPELISQGSCASPNHRIRPPPVDDVNNLGHDDKCQRCFASTAIQIRRNALFTSSEYAQTDLPSALTRGVADIHLI